jgi:hypothetical protein
LCSFLQFPITFSLWRLDMLATLVSYTIR